MLQLLIQMISNLCSTPLFVIELDFVIKSIDPKDNQFLGNYCLKNVYLNYLITYHINILTSKFT
ncbi:hypothetical protein V1477_011669 [Vespula maculifrons]|uniref:Uncharacterized protein n=1 Tax=Vespula maculifrons TaxID=7453 RepID=A0ABD2C0E9_VESMC